MDLADNLQDKDALNRIKARHLLVVIQHHLAHTLGITKSKYGGAAKWDEYLAKGTNADERIQIAREKLKPFAAKDHVLQQFISSEGLSLVVNDTCLRTQGNSAAHPFPVKKEAFMAITEGKPGLLALLEFAVEITKNMKNI